MKNNALKQARAIACKGDERHLIEAQKILLGHLRNNPQDIDSLLLLTTIEWNCPLEDPERIVQYINKILDYDPINVDALLFLAEAYEVFLGGITDEIYSKLCLLGSDDFEMMAMLEYAKARYFKHKNPDLYKKSLEKSVEYSADQVRNCSELGLLYVNQGKIKEGKRLIQRAIANVKAVDTKWDEASIECWYNYYYKGTEIPQWMYDDLQLLLKKCEKL